MKPMQHEIDASLNTKELDEIIGSPPIRLMQWGFSILVIILIIFLYIGFNIWMPETVPASVKKDSAQLFLPMIRVEIKVKRADFFKIKVGQEITFNCSDLSNKGYESLRGIIDSIKGESGDSTYFIKACLICKLKVNEYGRFLFREGFEGNADITVDKRRLIEKIFQKKVAF
jgi:hypothetical protein